MRRKAYYTTLKTCLCLGCVFLLAIANGCDKTATNPAPSVPVSLAKRDQVLLKRVVYPLAPPQSNPTVDPHQGSLFVSSTDLVVAAGAIELRIERCYQTFSRETGLLGNRWRLNWESRLKREGTSVVIEEWLGPVVFELDAQQNVYRTASGEEIVFENDMAIRKKNDCTREVFDVAGNLSERELRNGNRLVVERNSEGRLLRITGPYRSFVNFIVDSDGLLSRIESSTGITVKYAFDEQVSPEVSNADGDFVKYAYSDTGELLRMSAPRSGETEFKYNRNQVVSCSTDGTIEEFEYNETGDIKRTKDAAGHVTLTHWNAEQTMAVVTDPSGQATILEYGVSGLPTKITGTTGNTIELTYDTLGRTVAISSESDGATRFEYVANSPFLKSIRNSKSDGQLFEYDEQLNLLSITKEGNACPIASFSYSIDGRVETQSSCGNASRTFEYDRSG